MWLGYAGLDDWMREPSSLSLGASKTPLLDGGRLNVLAHPTAEQNDVTDWTPGLGSISSRVLWH